MDFPLYFQKVIRPGQGFILASYELHEAMAVSRYPMVYSLLRKQLIQFCSMYSEQGSQHPSSELSYTLECLFYLYFTYFNKKKTQSSLHYITPEINPGNLAGITMFPGPMLDKPFCLPLAWFNPAPWPCLHKKRSSQSALVNSLL